MKQKHLKKALSALLTISLVSTSAAMLPLSSSAAAVVSLSPTDVYEINNGVFEGWGTSLCWWANRVGYSDSLAQQTADAFYGENGLRMNIARFNIGGGDDPTHNHITRTDSNMPGYTTYSNGNVTYNWSADANQRNVLQRCVKAAGDDAIVEMFSNSPPYYMTNSGCSTGNKDAGKNNLRDDSYTAFAEYLAEVCKHYEDVWNIKVQSVEPLNEPYTNFWGAYSAKQEGCHFDIGNSESKIILELQKSMAKRGMQDVILSGTDETSIDTQIDAFNALSADAKNAIGRIDTHTYGGSKRSQLKETAIKAGKNLWMSEVDGNGTAGTNAGEMAAGLWLAGRITTDCNDLNASAWIIWQAIDKHICAAGWNGKKDSGMPDISTGFWGTAVADHDKNKIVLTKKYYCFGQYTRYIRPGMTMLKSSGSTMAAYDKENKQVVIVSYNTSGNASDISFDLSQFDTVGTSAKVIRTSASESWADAGNAAVSGKVLKTALAPNSVTTFIIDGVTGGSISGDLIPPVSVNGSESWKNDAKYDYNKAFDGDKSTYFDGLSAGWVEADLGGTYDITAFGYCPRSGYEGRCTDGMFQVSEDGSTWQTVCTISGKPSFGTHYVKPESGAVSARYIRYQVPEGKPNNEYNTDSSYCCNIAEISVYGFPKGISDDNKISVNAANVTGSDPWHQSANTAQKVFDGNTATYFDGVGDGWVQADLGDFYRIDSIAYCPRSGFEYRCTDGYFEISTDGVNWTTIHTIAQKPASGMNYVQSFDTDTTARYIRYAVPSGAPANASNPDEVYCCNIAEIALYGEKTAAPVTTSTTTAVTTTTITTTVTTTSAITQPSLPGDVNCDETVDVADAVLLARMLAEDKSAVVSSQGIRNADCNDSGQPDAKDVVVILQFVARLIEEI
ncbi:MAG: discoidin domain-containing protein [Oscillospiraceae bacterium]|nr:discoidin domain-containing protein [Oscillospiraceae bacterium]